MSDLTPLEGVRSEHFLNGEDLKPITRKEHFYAGQESKLPEGHQEPETREEWFIKKFRGSGGGTTVEALTVTENGTYSEEGKAYSPVTVNVDKGLEVVALPSAEVVSFSDGEALPITSGKFYINAVQEGSGTPSPDNVRPITGFSSMDITRCGINIWDEEWEVGGYNGSNGNKWGTTDRIRSKSTNYIPIKPSTTYYNNSPVAIYFFYYDKDKNYISYEAISINITFTTPSNAYYMRFFVNATYGTTYNNDISINYPSTDTLYHVYNGKTQTISFRSTIYGGYYDSITGKLVITHGNIASYNGEVLPGAWLSSMDEYVEGATPTTGAQVVYELATPTETDVSTACITTLEGTNNIYHNCNGNTEISVLKEA